MRDRVQIFRPWLLLVDNFKAAVVAVGAGTWVSSAARRWHRGGRQRVPAVGAEAALARDQGFTPVHFTCQRKQCTRDTLGA